MEKEGVSCNSLVSVATDWSHKRRFCSSYGVPIAISAAVPRNNVLA
ncbi:hypothetical protein GPSY_1740 [Paraglaciecola psychrophila 170]|nr:hypothetical protein GPSY_1740 [Paraglaciecola psychrophila 170]